MAQGISTQEEVTMSERTLEYSYEPDQPSYWYRLGKQDAMEGADPRVIDTAYATYQVDYDEGYRVGKYLDPIEDRETI